MHLQQGSFLPTAPPPLHPLPLVELALIVKTQNDKDVDNYIKADMPVSYESRANELTNMYSNIHRTY